MTWHMTSHEICWCALSCIVLYCLALYCIICRYVCVLVCKKYQVLQGHFDQQRHVGLGKRSTVVGKKAHHCFFKQCRIFCSEENQSCSGGYRHTLYQVWRRVKWFLIYIEIVCFEKNLVCFTIYFVLHFLFFQKFLTVLWISDFNMHVKLGIGGDRWWWRWWWWLWWWGWWWWWCWCVGSLCLTWIIKS